MNDEEFLAAIKIEPLVNRPGNILPFGYCHPVGKILWMCGEDEDRRITSVFAHADEERKTEKICAYLGSYDEALHMRDELIANGWTKVVQPKITTSLTPAQT